MNHANMGDYRAAALEYIAITRRTSGAYFSTDVQHINDPGYNRDRGPVTVPGMRLHLEL